MGNPNPSPETRWKPGQSGNPNGRPKGRTLKEFAREMLLTMDEEEKKVYLKELPKEIVWRMAEGNPHQTSELAGEITVANPLLHGIRYNNSDQKNLPDAETDKGDSGRNSSG